MKTTAFTLVALALLGVMATTATAEVVGVDLETNDVHYNGVGVLDTTSRLWHDQDASNDFTLDGDTITYATNAPLQGLSWSTTGCLEIFHDGEYANTETVTASLSGLKTDGTTYSLVIFAQMGLHNRGAAVTLGTTKNSPGTGDGAAFRENENYVRFDDLTPDGTGKIEWTWVKLGARGTINAFEMESVPEPATMSLLALGGIAMLRRRKK